jgi:CO dehydrogenase nickel-insertion accessory protein CooC1
MVRKAFKSKSEEASGIKTKRSRQEILNIKQVMDELVSVRCPVCRLMLIARMGRRGPGFYCRCPALKKAA